MSKVSKSLKYIISDCYTWNGKSWSGIIPCEQDATAENTAFCDVNFRVVPSPCGKEPSQCVECGKEEPTSRKKLKAGACSRPCNPS